MFATIVGALPDPPDAAKGSDADAVLRAQLAAQVEAGIELLSAAEPSEPTEDVLPRWRRAARLAVSVGGGAVKAAIVGPFSATGGRVSEDATERTRRTIGDLLDAGCQFVEVHEPAAVGIGDDPAARAGFAETQQRLTDGLDGHLCLAIVGGSADAAGAATIFAGRYRSYLFDLISGADNWRLIAAAPPDVGIVAGALDHRPAVHEVPETVVWAAHYAASTGGRGIDRVGVSSAGSLRALPWELALQRLAVLGKAARIAAIPGGEELGRALDPRAVDIRSAAVGRFAPARRGPALGGARPRRRSESA